MKDKEKEKSKCNEKIKSSFIQKKNLNEIHKLADRLKTRSPSLLPPFSLSTVSKPRLSSLAKHDHLLHP